MKKLISLALAICMIFSLSACGAPKPADDKPAVQPTAEPVVEPTEEPVDEEPSAPTPGTLVLPALPEANTSGEADVSGLNAFVASTLKPMFANTGDANMVYSPMNVYLALAMLAEVTDGDTRDQILDVLGQHDLDALRKEVAALWETSYMAGSDSDDHPQATILPAASFWLRDGIEYHADALNSLAQNHYASAFRGQMGSGEYSQRLRDWVNENTKHLLEEQANGLSLDKDTILALVTTLYFKANWREQFTEAGTTDDVFHAPSEDLTVPFMHRTDSMSYYRGNKFSAVYLPMASGNGMWILLPDENVFPEELLADEEAIAFLTDGDAFDKCSYPRVRLSLPKFDVCSDIDLCAMLSELGVSDVFVPYTADFTPLTDETGLAVTDIEHAARVKIDEEGCEAAAFTVISVKATGMFMEEDPIEFTCDRPFFFAVTGSAQQMLFAGIVNTPQND